MKVFFAARVKYAVVSVLISIAFESQAFAVLRPLFPTKPEPPFSGEAIVIRDDLVEKQIQLVDAQVIDRPTNEARDAAVVVPQIARECILHVTEPSFTSRFKNEDLYCL